MAFPAFLLNLMPRPGGLAGDLLSALEADATPRVAFLAFDAKPQFQEIYQRTLTAFKSRCTVEELATHRDAAEYLRTASNLKAVIAMDRSVTRFTHAHASVHIAIKTFVRSGGTLLFMGQAVCLQEDGYFGLEFYFSQWWQLPWKWGYTTNANAEHRLQKGFAGRELKDMPEVMTAQAKNLNKVREKEMVYTHRGQSAFCLGQFGSGFVGWVGDKNAGKESLELALAMCGL